MSDPLVYVRPPQPATTSLASILNAISSVETKGYNGDAKYAVVGPANKKGQKPYGKYQVMDFNIPAWTKEALGKSMTPDQFLKSPQAQEAVANLKLGQIYTKYGNASDTASVWFSGRPVAKAGNDSDVTGTTVPQYVAAVNAAIPGQKNPIAQAGEQTISAALAAYRKLFNVNPDLYYNRTQYDAAHPATSTPQASTPQQTKPNLARLFTPNGVLTTPFGATTQQEGFHPGIDVAAPKGTPIPSTVPGTVTATDYGHQQGENNFGNNVTITDANGDQHRYSHLNNGYVKVGQPVAKGQPIGEFGNSGATYSPSGKGDGTNLDYRIVSAYGQYKNPMLYLKNFA